MFEKMLIFTAAHYRELEQLVARQAHNPEVGGSSPPSATKNKALTKSALSYYQEDSNLHRRQAPSP